MKLKISELKKIIAEANLATRYLGTCAFCNKRTKVQKDRLVLHGYQRPGTGYAEGQCPGAGMKPYELDVETAALGLEIFSREATQIKRSLKLLDEDPMSMTIDVGSSWKPSVKTIGEILAQKTQGVSPETAKYITDNLINDVRKRIKGKLITAENIVEEFKNKVDNWTSKPLLSWDEEKSKADAGKEERKNQRFAAKQEKYNTMKSRLKERVASAFAKFKQAENKFSKYDGKVLDEVGFKLAYDLYDKHYKLSNMIIDNTYKMFDVMLGHIDRQQPYRDLEMDDILVQLGILQDGNYKIEPFKHNYETIPKLGQVWKKTWE